MKDPMKSRDVPTNVPWVGHAGVGFGGSCRGGVGHIGVGLNDFFLQFTFNLLQMTQTHEIITCRV